MSHSRSARPPRSKEFSSTARMGGGKVQTPPDRVVKFHPADMAEVIAWLVVALCAVSQRDIKRRTALTP
jgi:hypothetical protein